MQGHGSNQGFAVAQSGIVRTTLRFERTKPAPLHTAVDLFLQGAPGPIGQTAHDRNSQGHRDGCGRTAIPQGFGCRKRQIVGGEQNQFAILEHPVYDHQLRIQLDKGREREKGGIARICYNQHRASWRQNLWFGNLILLQVAHLANSDWGYPGC